MKVEDQAQLNKYFDEYQRELVVDIISRCANQRVIEELEKQLDSMRKIYADMDESTLYDYVGGNIESLIETIKELKQ